MKKLLVAAAASTALFATPAFAQTATESFDVTAAVPESCLMEDIDSVDLGEIDIVRSSGANALTIEASSIAPTNSFFISCNDTSTLTFSTANGGLLNQDRPTVAADEVGVFTNLIEYHVRLDNFVEGGIAAAPRMRTIDLAAGGTTTGFTRGAVHREVTAQVAMLQNENPLRPLAGDYEDTVTVSITTL
jgi:spore coat protein U-like protein